MITPEADPAEFELWVAFEEVRAVDHSEARTELIEDLVRRADAGDVRPMTFRCRRFLAHAYQMHGRWNLVYPLFRECLDEYDRRPWRFDAEDEANLLEWYARPAECMVDFPDYGLPEIHATLDDVERRFRAGGYDLHAAHGGDRASVPARQRHGRAVVSVDARRLRRSAARGRGRLRCTPPTGWITCGIPRTSAGPTGPIKLGIRRLRAIGCSVIGGPRCGSTACWPTGRGLWLPRRSLPLLP